MECSNARVCNQAACVPACGSVRAAVHQVSRRTNMGMYVLHSREEA